MCSFSIRKLTLKMFLVLIEPTGFRLNLYVLESGFLNLYARMVHRNAA
jgi:hypothetical protein